MIKWIDPNEEYNFFQFNYYIVILKGEDRQILCCSEDEYDMTEDRFLYMIEPMIVVQFGSELRIEPWIKLSNSDEVPIETAMIKTVVLMRKDIQMEYMKALAHIMKTKIEMRQEDKIMEQEIEDYIMERDREEREAQIAMDTENKIVALLQSVNGVTPVRFIDES